MQKNEILPRDLGDDGILRLTLNDVGRRNALSEAMLAESGAFIGKRAPHWQDA